MNAKYLQRLTPKKREKQIERAEFHRLIASHRHGYGSGFNRENLRIQGKVAHLNVQF